MSLVRWMAIAMLVAAPVAVAAEIKPTPTDPANPAAAASPLQYESAFANYQPSPEEGESAQNVWRAANDEVAKIGGHAGHIKADVNSTPRQENANSAPAATKLDPAPASPNLESSGAQYGQHGIGHKDKGK